MIGSTNFEEQAIVSNIWADVLKKAGYPVTVEPALGTRAIVVPAIEKGQINLEPDYAASLLGFLHGGTPQAAGDNIATAIPADQKALAVLRRDRAACVEGARHQRLRRDQVDGEQGPPDDHLEPEALRVEADARRAAGVPHLRRVRAGPEEGLRPHTSPASSRSTRPGPLSVAALKNGEVQVVELFSSDGNVVSNNFVALTDNKHLEGADYIVPVIRKSVDTSGVASVLNKIDAKLTTTAISKLNLDVTSKQEQPAAVAQAWVTSVGG